MIAPPKENVSTEKICKLLAVCNVQTKQEEFKILQMFSPKRQNSAFNYYILKITPESLTPDATDVCVCVCFGLHSIVHGVCCNDSI